MKREKKVVMVIVEGPSDESAMESCIRQEKLKISITGFTLILVTLSMYYIMN